MLYKGPLTKEGVYAKLKLANLLDFSSLPPEHKFFDTSNCNRLNFWKDETKGGEIEEFAGVSSKSYGLRVKPYRSALGAQAPHQEIKKLKGISKSYRKGIPFDVWRNCVLNISKHRVHQFNISSKNHVIRTLRQAKIAITSFDDKRYICPCGVHTVAYGHYRIAVMEELNRCVFCKQ